MWFFTLKKVSQPQHTRMRMGGERVKIRFSKTNLLKNKERIVIVVKTLLSLMFLTSIRLLGSGGGVLVKRFACGAGLGFDSWDRHYHWRVLVSPISKSRYDWNNPTSALCNYSILLQTYSHFRVQIILQCPIQPSSPLLDWYQALLHENVQPRFFFTLRVDKGFIYP